MRHVKLSHLQKELTVSGFSDCITVLASEAIRTDTAIAVVRILIAVVLTGLCQ